MTEITKLPTPDRPPDEAAAPDQRQLWLAVFLLKRIVRAHERMLTDLRLKARRVRLARSALSGPFDGARRAQVEETLHEISAAMKQVLADRAQVRGNLADTMAAIDTRNPHELAALLGINHKLITNPDASLFTLAYMGAETASDRATSVWDSGREHLLHDAAFRRVLDEIANNPVMRRQATEIGRACFPGSAFDEMPQTHAPVLIAV